MIGTFAGQLSVGDEHVDVDLEMSGQEVRLATPVSEIGTWPLDAFRVTPKGDGTFDLLIDGDQVAFAPLQPGAFESAIAALLSGTAVPSSETTLERIDPEVSFSPEPRPEPGLAPGPGLATDGDPDSLAFSDEQAPEEDLVSAPEAWDSPAEGEVGDHEAEISRASSVEELLEAERKLRTTSKFSLGAPNLKKGLLAAGLLVLVGVIAFTAPTVIAAITGSSSVNTFTETTASPPATTTTVVAVPPSTPVPTTVPTEAVAPDLSGSWISADEFSARWNKIGGSVAAALKLPAALLPGEFEYGLTSYLWVSGLINERRGVEQYTVTIDPTGPPASDQLGMQTLGVAVAVAAPELEGPALADVLALLGLDVRDPRLAGIDGLYENDGVGYRLVFDEETERLVLSITFSSES